MTKETAVPSNRKRAPPRNDTETVIKRFQYIAIQSTPNSSIEHIGSDRTLVLVASR